MEKCCCCVESLKYTKFDENNEVRNRIGHKLNVKFVLKWKRNAKSNSECTLQWLEWSNDPTPWARKALGARPKRWLDVYAKGKELGKPSNVTDEWDAAQKGYPCPRTDPGTIHDIPTIQWGDRRRKLIIKVIIRSGRGCKCKWRYRVLVAVQLIQRPTAGQRGKKVQRMKVKLGGMSHLWFLLLLLLLLCIWMVCCKEKRDASERILNTGRTD